MSKENTAQETIPHWKQVPVLFQCDVQEALTRIDRLIKEVKWIRAKFADENLRSTIRQHEMTLEDLEKKQQTTTP